MKWFTQSLIHLVIRVSNLKMHMKKVAFWPEYEFHYYRSFQVVLRLHMSLFFLQHLINQKCLAGHIYVNIISQLLILANISGASYSGCIMYYKYNTEGARKGSMMHTVFIPMIFYLHS